MNHFAPSSSKTLVFAIVVCGGCLFVNPACPQSPPQEIDESKFKIETLELGKKYWHGIYIGNKKSGYMRTGFERRGAAGQEVFAFITKTELKFLVQGRANNITTLEVAEFDTKQPYAMVSSYSSVENQLGRTTIKANVENEILTAQIEESGRQRTQTLNSFHYTLPMAAAYSLMDFGAIKPGDSYTYREFSVSELRFDPQFVKFIGGKESVVDGVKVKFYEADVRSGTHNMSGRFRFSENAKMLSAVIGGVFEMRNESESNARNFDYSADLSVLGVIRLNQPIGDPSRVASLELKVPPRFANAIQSSSTQSIVSSGNGYFMRLGAKHGSPLVASAEDIAENSRETVEYPINAPEVKGLLARAVGNEVDPRRKVQKLVNFVSGFLADSLNDNALSVQEIIRRRRGDCTEHATLFATLARAAGIPTREVGGFIYGGDDTKAFGAHAWNEVVIDGRWQAVDPMWNEVQINATHIQLKDESQLFSLGSTLQVLKVERR